MLSLWKKQVKTQLKNATPTELLVQIPSQNPKIKWLEKGKEFELQGQRFDIISVEKGNYICFLDNIETDLINKIVSQYTQKSTQSTDYQFSIFHSFEKNLFCESITLLPYWNTPLKNNTNYYPIIFQFFIHFVEFWLPPKK